MFHRVIGAISNNPDVSEILSIARSYEYKGIKIQLLDCKNLSIENLEIAVEHALKNVKSRSRARDIGVEILRFASGKRQVRDAMEELKTTERTEKFGVVILSKDEISSGMVEEIISDLGLKMDEGAFISTSGDLIYERMALLKLD